MNLDELLALNREGLIPGPGETEESFLERVEAAKRAAAGSAIPSPRWEWPSVQLQSLYGFSPRWCSATLSSKGLAPWQGAAIWIDVKRVYTIQISSRPWVRWLIDREELLAHEAAHAARAAFDEPMFEEIFAYLTSSAKWRRILGPLFSRPIQALLFVASLAGGSLLQLLEVLLERPLYAEMGYLCAAGLFLAASLRCLKGRWLLTRAMERVKRLLRNPADALAVLFRCRDREIAALAKGEPLVFSDELRCRLLKAAYFKDDAFFY